MGPTRRCKEIDNFEYALNRAYAYNRDKKKCRVCGESIHSDEMSFHRINPYLPLGKVNRVNNLASVHERCHRMIHDEQDYSTLGKKHWRKILKFREKL
ncbi:HNH endonuclease [Paenibacillus terreus]|uniref:HNH endonuclease n=1 Tax=Paenibacillus terreus TaxID=1387834 RepID=A0ABV5BEA5_9BACL